MLGKSIIIHMIIYNSPYGDHYVKLHQLEGSESQLDIYRDNLRLRECGPKGVFY